MFNYTVRSDSMRGIYLGWLYSWSINLVLKSLVLQSTKASWKGTSGNGKASWKDTSGNGKFRFPWVYYCANVQECICAFPTERQAAEHFALSWMYFNLPERWTNDSESALGAWKSSGNLEWDIPDFQVTHCWKNKVCFAP